LCSINASLASQFGSFGKGGSDLRIAREVLAAKLRVIDLSSDGSRAQHFIGSGLLLLPGRFRPSLAVTLVSDITLVSFANDVIDAPQRSGIDVLGWDFAFELNETARQEAELAGINLRLIRIPREVLEKKAVEQGDIKFFELAALSVGINKKARTVTLKLTDFMIPLDDVPEEVQKAVTHWEQWIDYWAVDWNNSDDTFHNEWQSYRTRKDSTLARETSHTYDEAGKYRIVVKVIDILGNDTTRLIQVEVK